METAIIVAIAASLLCAGAVYVVLEYRQFGERQEATNKLLKVQTQVAAVQKELQGYTQFTQYLAPCKLAMADNMRALAAKVVREFTLTESLQKEPLKLRSVVTIILKYNVECTIGVDLKPENFELIGTPAGIEIQVGKPALIGFATGRPLSSEIPNEGVLPNEPVTIKEIQQKLPQLAQKHGAAMATEEAVMALCERKLVEFVRSFLVKQAGVKHVPMVAVVYK